jgi:triosephosphate isomerase
MQKKLIVGNWKMNKTSAEAFALAGAIKKNAAIANEVDIVLCPPFTALAAVYNVINGTSIMLGGQNIHWEDSGAYTGEVSAAMLKEAGCKYAIIGHSERRKYFGETNETVSKKLKSALTVKLIPILCIGETLLEREDGRAFQVVEDHLRGGLNGIGNEEMQRVVIAYEPVWAIGTGRVATPIEAKEMHLFVYELLDKIYGKDVSSSTRVIYGGSVTPENISSLLDESEIRGALVGGASLTAESFSQIIRAAQTATYQEGV